MALTRWDTTPAGTTPIQITNLKLNANSYELWKATAGYEDSVTLGHNIDGTFRLQPNVAPVSAVQLFQIRSSAGAVMGYFDSSGNLYAQNLIVTGTASINLLPITGQNMPSLLVSGIASINTLLVGAGGIVSTRDDGSYQYKLVRTAATARSYGLAIDASGNFLLDDVTAAQRRVTLYPSGGLAVGPAGTTDPGQGGLTVAGQIQTGTTGAVVSLTAGAGDTGQAGGTATVQAGPGGATSGAGGAASLLGGAGTAGNSAGGTVTVQAGASAGGIAGPNATLQAGAGGGGGASPLGGDAKVIGGTGGATSGRGGSAYLQGGTAGGGNSAGGNVFVLGGDGRGTQLGGAASLKGGNSSTTNGSGPGSVSISGGDAQTGSNGNGGRTSLSTGAANGTGTRPLVEIDGSGGIPTSASLLAGGYIGFRYVGGGGALTAYVNDGGTIKSLALGVPA